MLCICTFSCVNGSDIYESAYIYMYVCACIVSQLCPTPCSPMNCSPPSSSVHGILQQEYWSGLPFPTAGNLSSTGIKPASLGSYTGRQILYHLGSQHTSVHTFILYRICFNRAQSLVLMTFRHACCLEMDTGEN